MPFTGERWSQLGSLKQRLPSIMPQLPPSPEAALSFLGNKNPPAKLRSQRMRLALKYSIPNEAAHGGATGISLQQYLLPWCRIHTQPSMREGMKENAHDHVHTAAGRH